MNLGALGKLIGIAGDVGGQNSKSGGGSAITGLASTLIGSAFPPAGMVMGLLSSTGIMDSLFSSHPEEAQQIQEQMNEFDKALEEMMQQAKNIDRYVDHMSDEEVNARGEQAGYF